MQAQAMQGAVVVSVGLARLGWLVTRGCSYVRCIETLQPACLSCEQLHFPFVGPWPYKWPRNIANRACSVAPAGLKHTHLDI